MMKLITAAALVSMIGIGSAFADDRIPSGDLGMSSQDFVVAMGETLKAKYPDKFGDLDTSDPEAVAAALNLEKAPATTSMATAEENNGAGISEQRSTTIATPTGPTEAELAEQRAAEAAAAKPEPSEATDVAGTATEGTVAATGTHAVVAVDGDATGAVKGKPNEPMREAGNSNNAQLASLLTNVLDAAFQRQAEMYQQLVREVADDRRGSTPYNHVVVPVGSQILGQVSVN